LANVLDHVYLSVDRRAVVTAAKQIVASEIDIAVAGGSENMDRAPNLTAGGR
jgi:acetyl-CoA C-acetyltransferase